MTSRRDVIRDVTFSAREGSTDIEMDERDWVSVLDGELYAIAALTLQNGRIMTMDILLDPARLARLSPTDFDARL